MLRKSFLVPLVALFLVCTSGFKSDPNKCRSDAKTLFPTDLPSKEWVQFEADGFSKPACGVIYRTGDKLTNGMALGGVGTGCIDLEPTGLLGYSTIFNSHLPRRGPINLPILGISVGGTTWVLFKDQPKEAELASWLKRPEPVLNTLNLY